MQPFSKKEITGLLIFHVADSDLVPWMVFEFMQYGDLAELLRANAYNRSEGHKSPFIHITKVRFGHSSNLTCDT